ncbi:MAG TPA: aldo/keto reductase [Burkholderiales bacterium]|nr:aldo/keto reductase [Burkholderiales bacterium]
MPDSIPNSHSVAARAALNDGNRMPWLGLGVYTLRGRACLRATAHALSVGYRHVDTAAFYGNEEEVGRAVRESGVARDEVFVVTKLWNSDQGYASAIRACNDSLARLALDYVDLYLIHWPEPGRRLESWRALVELRAQGKCRSIGVSNYTIAHLKELMAHSKVAPAVNQVEFSPFLYQRDLLEFCRSHAIQLEAYCPLTRGRKLRDPVLVSVAQRHGKTPAQILLRWALQHEVAVIPKSEQPARIDENGALFDFALDARDMAALDALDAGFRTCWNPTGVA